MQNKSTRRGNTQKNRVGQALPDNALAKGHSPFLEKGNNPSYCQVKPDLHKLIAYRLGVSPTGVASAPENIRCKAGKLSGSHPTYEEEALNKDSFRAPLRSAFTLIELLVVVLIIGILAAVAVPQYQKAVEKSYFQNLVMTFHQLSKAQALYYLTHGNYATALEQLDIAYNSTNNTGNEISFGTNRSCRIESTGIICLMIKGNYEVLLQKIYERDLALCCTYNDFKADHLCLSLAPGKSWRNGCYMPENPESVCHCWNISI